MANLIRYQDRDVVNDTQKLTTSTWTDNTNNLTVAFTSSTQALFGTATSSGAHYVEVFNKNPQSDTTAVTQYAIAYGHRKGSGSLDFTNDTGAKGKSPSSNVYSQYRQLVFGDEASNFSFNGFVPDDIYVINVERARFKHNLKPGTLDLRLSGSSGMAILHLTDDAVTQTGSSTSTNAGRQFNIVSGSLGTMLGSNLTQVSDSGSYGFFYPDSGFIILNPSALKQNVDGLTPVTTANNDAQNYLKLWNHISGSTTTPTFIVDSQETVSSQFYFTRVTNTEFNYTTNPSFVDNVGNLNFTSMIDNPTTFITTIGLYNDSGDLVAVAKLSQPVAKDFTKEALIRVKLDY